MDIDFKIDGLEEIQRRLSELDAKTEPKVLKQTVRASARPVILDARRRVAYAPEVAKKLKVVSVEANQDGTVTAHVGLPSKNKGGSYVGLWIEKGTAPRIQKTTGRRTGAMPARPFLGPALRSQKDRVIDRFGTEIRKRISKYLS